MPLVRAQTHPGMQQLTCKGFKCFEVWIVDTRSENSVIEDKHCPGSCIEHGDNNVSLSSEPVANSTSLVQESDGT